MSMGTEYMTKVVADFLRDIDKIESELDGFSRDLDARSGEVAKLLADFEQQGTALAAKMGTGKQNGVDAALQASLAAKNDALLAWKQRIEEDRKGRAFMHKHEKHLVVMVFGAVKSGKSTLGNFFGGREFRHAAFDNGYQHIPLPTFQTEENGRETGGLKEDADGETWFAEGVVDTTGSIQYFTLSGLRWMDSPGTGAIGKAGDKRRMDEMVDAYLPYADMCIFLINSGQPGLQEDMRYMEKLSREGQDAIIVITRSDTVNEDEDDEGNIVRVRVPKSPQVRKRQEDDMRERALAAYPMVQEEHCKAISISSLLARKGIETENEQTFRDSHIDLLMQMLGEKAAGDAARLKEKRPRRTFNAFVDEVLGTSAADGNGANVAALHQHLEQVTAAIQKSQNDMDKAARLLTMDIKNGTRRRFLQAANTWEKEVASGKAELTGEDIADRVSEMLHDVMQQKINATIGKILADYEAQEFQDLHLQLHTKGLQRKTETITREYTTVDYVERGANTLWENVCSLFGKKYYREVRKKHTEKRTIDLGTNLEELIDELLPQLVEQVQPTVEREMQHLRNSYFAPQAQYVQAMTGALQTLEEGLKRLRYEV